MDKFERFMEDWFFPLAILAGVVYIVLKISGSV